MSATSESSATSASSCTDGDVAHSPSNSHKWWNNNQPKEQWTANCPDFLVGQSEKNIGILSSKDEDFVLTSWDEARQYVESGCIDLFGRTPTELRRYVRYIYDLRKKFGSVLYYMQHERLNWVTTEPSGEEPFANTADYTILYNDWPYALDPKIKHLVVWTKFRTEEDPTTDDLTPRAKAAVEDFVVRTFCGVGSVDCESNMSTARSGFMKRDDIIWFKNWTRLRSVHALEHFHVLLYNAPHDLLARVTQGDVPMSEKLTKQDERN